MPKNTDIFSGMTLEIVEVNQRRVEREWNHEEFNPFAKIYYVSDGAGQVKIGSSELVIEKGKLYLIPPYMPLKLNCENFLDHIWVHFIIDRFSSSALFDLTRDNYELTVDKAGTVLRQMQDLLFAYNAGGVRDMLMAQGLVRQILVNFLPEDESILPAREIMEFRKTLEYIEDNLDDDLTNTDLADLHRWHPTYFANRFSKALGISPRNYIVRKRVEKARQLLWTGKLTVAQVACEVGFSDEYYFSKVFKKLTGIPPGKYQKQAGVVNMNKDAEQ